MNAIYAKRGNIGLLGIDSGAMNGYNFDNPNPDACALGPAGNQGPDRITKIIMVGPIAMMV